MLFCHRFDRSSFLAANEFRHAVTYAVIPTFLTCAVSNVHFINIGLKHCDALVFIPIYYVLVILGSTVVVCTPGRSLRLQRTFK
jgi:hypothetical protein